MNFFIDLKSSRVPVNKNDIFLQNNFNNLIGKRVPPAFISSEANWVAIMLFLFDFPEGLTNLKIS